MITTALQAWLQRDPDPNTRAELERLVESNDEDEITRRFSGRLEFGTAGLRGIVGAGPARMNRLVVRETSAGLGRYLHATLTGATQRGVVLAYDGRLDSPCFAHDAASVFAALGFKVYITANVAPTPLAAYGVVHLDAAAGVVVTASHNPPEYNGYKVYWENGAQIIPPHDAGIAAAIETAARQDLPWEEFDAAVADGRIILLDAGFAQSYCAAIIGNYLFQRSDDLDPISIAYTAMHGVGANIAEALLQQAGVTRFFSVAAQREPDGNFPTVNFPNPEEPGAMDAVIALAREHHASLACANDPDADRLAIAVRAGNGNYQMLSGDQLGVLLGHYLLHQPHEFTPIVCTTIVSSSMLEAIAKEANAVFFVTLTGFKWLANVALDNENAQRKFLFAYEEALGYAVGRLVRDKDGLSALLAFVQMTAQLQAQGKTVLAQLEFLYRRHGLHLTRQVSIAMQAGSASIGAALRAAQPLLIAGRAIETIEDLQSGRRYCADGSVEKIELAGSDVLIYRLAGGGRVIVRPSGTEPKVKCYYEVVEEIDAAEEFATAEKRAQGSLSVLIERHQAALASLMA